MVKGVVMIFTNETGRAIANAADFATDGYGGFTLLEAQRLRARGALAGAVAEAYASPDFTRALSSHQLRDVLSRLENAHGCKITEVVIGHEGEE